MFTIRFFFKRHISSRVYSSNSTWLDTSLHGTFDMSSAARRARRARRVEYVEPCGSTTSTQPKCMGSTTRRTCRVETWRVEPSGIIYDRHYQCSFMVSQQSRSCKTLVSRNRLYLLVLVLKTSRSLQPILYRVGRYTHCTVFFHSFKSGNRARISTHAWHENIKYTQKHKSRIDMWIANTVGYTQNRYNVYKKKLTSKLS